MNKISFALCLFIACIFIVGCTNSDNSDTEIKSLQTQVAQLQEQNNKLAEQIQPTTTLAPIPDLTSTPEATIETIRKNQTITIPDKCLFTYHESYFGKKINPPMPKSIYKQYEAKDPGTTFLDTVIIYKNLQETGVMADDFGSVKIIYNGKYEYTSFSTIEVANGGDFGYSNITSIEPLTTGTVHYLAEVPEEVQKSNNSIEILINACGNDYAYKFR